MKIITVEEPLATAILRQGLTTIRRNWRVNFTGTIYLKSAHVLDRQLIKKIPNKFDLQFFRPGCILGSVFLQSCSKIYNPKDPCIHYTQGKYFWKFTNPCLLECPLYYIGRHRKILYCEFSSFNIIAEYAEEVIRKCNKQYISISYLFDCISEYFNPISQSLFCNQFNNAISQLVFQRRIKVYMNHEDSNSLIYLIAGKAVNYVFAYRLRKYI